MSDFSLSLEQEFHLKVLSNQIQLNFDICSLQDDLIELFKQILIIQQEMNSLVDNETIDCFVFSGEMQNKLTDYTAAITNTHDAQELQELLIQAQRMIVVQKNYTEIVRQDMLTPAWIKYGY